MKKTALILALCASIAAGSTSIHAKTDTIRLAAALAEIGITTMVVGQCVKWVYQSGKAKQIAKFCLDNPWYPIGGALLGTGGVLLCKDALIEIVSPITDLFQSTKSA
jgi:uncharacterized membrane protein